MDPNKKKRDYDIIPIFEDDDTEDHDDEIGLEELFYLGEAWGEEGLFN